MAAELRELGVPSKQSFTTQDHFVHCSAIARARGWKSAEIGMHRFGNLEELHSSPQCDTQRPAYQAKTSITSIAWAGCSQGRFVRHGIPPEPKPPQPPAAWLLQKNPCQLRLLSLAQFHGLID